MQNDFRAIALEIANGIKTGIYTETLPSISILSKQFGVCTATINRALMLLSDWDLVNGEHGRCVRINPKAESNEFFHKNIVILVSLDAVSIPYFEDTLTVLTNMLSKVYMMTHIFFSETQLRECHIVPDCILAVSNTSQVMLDTILKKYPDCPVVRFVHSSTNYPVVLPDNRRIGYEAIRYLADDCGHRHIGIIATQLKYKNDCFNQRYEGALEYAAAHPEVKLSMEEVPELEVCSQSSYHATETLMEKDSEITAVFALSDMLALGVYSYALQHKLTIPDDLAVIGSDNMGFSRCLVPALTTFESNAMYVAKLLFQQLLDVLQGKKHRNVLTATAHMIVRGSTQKDKLFLDN